MTTERMAARQLNNRETVGRFVPAGPARAIGAVALAMAVAGCASPETEPGMYVLQILGFIALCFVVATFGGMWFMRRAGVIPSRIAGGVPTTAVIQSISDTGQTATTPWTGPDAPGYRLELLVTPPGGGTPYPARMKTFVPRVYQPMMVPGAQIGVIVDPKNPARVQLDTSTR